MKKPYYFYLASFVILLPIKVTGQIPTPGGVQGILFWYKSQQFNNQKSILEDHNNKRYSKENFKTDRTLNTNFHEALFFTSINSSKKPTLILHNTKLDQASFIGCFYPEFLNNQLQPVSKEFYT